MTSSSHVRSQSRYCRRAYGFLILLCLLGLIPVQRSIDLKNGSGNREGEVLYLPSGKFLRKVSLGYEGLLADIYWTRAVQYFGGKRLAQSSEFKLLGPLLQITTDLDPHLIIAYHFGSIFLADKPLRGAGRTLGSAGASASRHCGEPGLLAVLARRRLRLLLGFEGLSCCGACVRNRQ